MGRSGSFCSLGMTKCDKTTIKKPLEGGGNEGRAKSKQEDEE